MPSINNIPVSDRSNRPQVDSKVMLRTYFINDGAYQDPYAVSTVHVFDRSITLSPNTILDANGLVASSMTGQARMVFGPSGLGVLGTDTSFDSSNYTGEAPTLDPNEGNNGAINSCSGVSGVYKLAKGEFASVLDGGLGSILSGLDQNGDIIQNTTSATGRYLDVWTVKMSADSAWSIYINNFELYDNTVFTVTEPLLLRSKNRLFNKRVILGSKTDLKIGTEITVENENINEDIKNIFKDSVITSAMVVIKKHNEDSNLPSRVTVVSSTSDVSITSDDTIVYTFDTVNDLTNGNPGSLELTDLGSKTGTYSVQVTYNMLAEKIVSPLMYFTVK